MTPEQEILLDGLAIMRRQTQQFVEDLVAHVAFMPLDPESEPTAEVRMNVTAFIKRFELMQDQITRKLFRSVLAVKGVRLRTNALAGVVEYMAAIGVVEDAERWRRVTELRNIFAHDYLLTFDVLARLVNEAWTLCPSLIAMVTRVDTYVECERLLEEQP